MPTDWLQSKHPIYEANLDFWKQQELRLRGGGEVLQELVRFEWEPEESEHFLARQKQATYLNFPDKYTMAMVGHLLRHAPTEGAGLSFGALGEVRRERTGDPTDAELVFFNADGVGNDGSQWDNFWLAALRRAIATGHRWMFVESPEAAATNRAQVLAGLRPYLIEFSPTVVPQWHYRRGRLEFAIIQLAVREPVLEKGSLEGNKPVLNPLLLVRAGWEGFGPAYAGGGWWQFDADGEKIVDQGDWAKTQGEIPLFPLFYQRDEGSTDWPTLSRSGTTELGNAAISYLNLSSAADFDAWDAAMSVQFLLGVDKEGWELAVAQMKSGSRWVALPNSRDSKLQPAVQDASTGAVVASVFDARLSAKRADAMDLAAQEATSVPESSGVSKVMGFNEVKSPRLALMASELEQAQNTAIRFLEMRFGNAAPSGSVVWPREFDLQDVLDSIREHFELEKLNGLTSPTLAAKLMVAEVKERGLVTDDAELGTIETEYQQSAKAAADAKEQQASLMASLRSGGGGAPGGTRPPPAGGAGGGGAAE